MLGYQEYGLSTKIVVCMEWSRPRRGIMYAAGSKATEDGLLVQPFIVHRNL